MIPQEQQDQAALYVLGLLESDEAHELEAAMREHAELREFVRELRETSAAIALSSAMNAPPANLRAAVLKEIEMRVATTSPAAYYRGRWIPWAIAACLALACLLLLVGRAQLSNAVSDASGRVARLRAERDRAVTEATESRQLAEVVQAQVMKLTQEHDALTKKISQLEERNATSQAQAAKLTADRTALQDRVAALEHNANAVIATLTSKLSDAPQAAATIVWDSAKQQGILRTADVPATTTEEDYQLWIADAKYNAPVNAGIFKVDKSGRTEMIFRPRLRITAATAFLVSLERKGGVSSPQGPIVLAGKL